jgi:flagellar basal-body rod modification protein FlgD
MSDASMWGSLSAIPQTDASWATTTRQPNSDLDRNAFLQLLITQMRHQDPLNPMDDRDFMAQMAQFSALEQMMNLNATFERTQAFNMIGKIIDAQFINPVSGEWVDIEGELVTAVTRRGESVFLTVVIDGAPVDVPFDSVSQVSEDFFVSQQLDIIFNQVQGTRVQDMIGRYVQAVTVNGQRLEFIEGRVDSVKLNGHQAILVIGNREVFFNEVSSVADNMRLIGSDAFTHGDYVTGVDIVRSGTTTRAYLLFDNDSRINIQNITLATDAINFVGLPFRDGPITGIVEDIQIRNGIPFLNVRRENGEVSQVNFADYLARRSGNEATNNNNATGDESDDA